MSEEDKEVTAPKLAATSGGKAGPDINGRFIAIVAVCILVIALVVGLAYNHNHSTKAKTAASTVGQECSTSTIASTMEQANKLFINDSAAATAQLKTITAKIQAIPNYQQDPNCLNVVVDYYVTIGDTTNANTYLTKLEAVYNSKVGYNSYIKPYAQTIVEFKSDIAELQQAKIQQEKNSSSFSNAP